MAASFQAARNRRAAKRNVKLSAYGPQTNQVKTERQRSVTPSNLPMKNNPCSLLTPNPTHN
jgi:hypothetical protein